MADRDPDLRKLEDEFGQGWQVRPEPEKERWRFEPLEGTDEMPRFTVPPADGRGPFDLKEHELVKMLDGARPRRDSVAETPPSPDEEQEGRRRGDRPDSGAS